MNSLPESNPTRPDPPAPSRLHPDTLVPLLRELVADLEADAPYAAVLLTHETGERIRAGSRQEEVTETPPSRGAVFTVHTGRALLETAVDDLRPEALRAAVARLQAHVHAATVATGTTGPDPGDPLDRHFSTPTEIPYESVPVAEKLAHARSLRERAEACDARVVNAFGMVSHTRSQELFVNRTRTLFQDLCRTQTVCGVTVSKDGAQAALVDGRAHRGGWEMATLPDDLVPTLVADCIRIAGAPRLEAGYYDCIFSPEFAGIFAHEAFGHGTEADMFAKQRSRGQEYLGQPVASTKVDMYDDPSLPGAAASYAFDHEGQLSSPTQIIEKGVLVRPITDLHTAHALGLSRTANGRREAFSHKAYTRMSNTFFGTGDSDLAEMLAHIDHGFYLQRPSNGMEDPKSWGIQLEGYMASEIVGGTFTGRVFSPVIVTGFVPDLLQSITRVGRDREITGLGMCGKGYKEWVKVTDGGPHLQLKARLA